MSFMYGCLYYLHVDISLTMKGSKCRVSNLRNGHVACPLAIHVPCRLQDAVMSHVEFKKCPMLCHSFFLAMSISLIKMSHVDFKK